MKTVAFRMAYHYFPVQAQKLCSRRGTHNLCASLPLELRSAATRHRFAATKKAAPAFLGQSSVISRRFGSLPHKLRVLRLPPHPSVSAPRAIGLRKQEIGK
jgi:hypothetical protein